jgi:prevent-host-death family protein
MDVSAKDLRERIGHYISMAEDGAEIVVTSHGRRRAWLIPYANEQRRPYAPDDSALQEKGDASAGGFLFGIWADRDDIEDVEDYVRSLRKGRVF